MSTVKCDNSAPGMQEQEINQLWCADVCLLSYNMTCFIFLILPAIPFGLWTLYREKQAVKIKFFKKTALTLSQARFLWRVTLLQRGQPSGPCPNGPSCTVYHAISVHGGDPAAFWRYAIHGTYLHDTRTGLTQAGPQAYCKQRPVHAHMWRKESIS